MREVFGMILFWITILFCKHLVETKGKIDKKFSLPITFTVIGLLEFFLGLIHLLKIGTWIWMGIILIVGIVEMIKGNLKIKKEDFLNPTNVMISLIFLGITIAGYSLHLTHYDNFSHWGLIIKSMLETNQLPNASTNYIMFKSYQPGSACFLYFLGLLCGKKEGFMIIAQNYLIFSYITVLFHYIPKERKWFGYPMVILFSVFLTITSTISFNNLLVDSLLSVMLIATCIILYEYRKNLKKAVLTALPIMIYLFAVKNTGILLNGILCLLILVFGWNKGKKKESTRYVFYIMGMIIFLLLIWSIHVKLSYGSGALSSKHSFSPQNFYLSLKALGLNNLLNFLKLYWFHLWEWNNNIPNQYMFFLNISLILYAIYQKNRKVVKWILGINAIYLLYYVILGGMYILSMPWEEAKVFAGFTRYMMMTVNAFVGMTIFYFFQNKTKKIPYVLGIVLLIVPIYFHSHELKVFIGKDGYQGSIIEKVDQVMDEIPREKENYYFYSPSSKEDFGYLSHVAIYKLLKKNVFVITKKEDFYSLKTNSCLIILEETNMEEEILPLEKISKNIYQSSR